jgi:hypothetical protein
MRTVCLLFTSKSPFRVSSWSFSFYCRRVDTKLSSYEMRLPASPPPSCNLLRNWLASYTLTLNCFLRSLISLVRRVTLLCRSLWLRVNRSMSPSLPTSPSSRLYWSWVVLLSWLSRSIYWFRMAILLSYWVFMADMSLLPSFRRLSYSNSILLSLLDNSIFSLVEVFNTELSL